VTAPITFTLDVEDHRPDEAASFRVPELVHAVLDFLAERSIRGTFFVVGELAEQVPDLVREIADAGHEIGLHGWRHEPVGWSTPDQFRADVAKGRCLLEDLTSTAVRGFRAPTYSLVAESAWAVDVLAEVGFDYSASVLPARNPLFGWPEAPRRPYRWTNGLVELPAPTAGVGSYRLPVLGGVYFRVIPSLVVSAALRLADEGVCPWLYCHPYDFDPDEEFWVVPDAGRVGSRLLWLNRRREFAKLDKLLRDGAGPPLGERVERLLLSERFDPQVAP
jgi:peptidoglycan-N-acetylglucosamine deacetylase